ncbi:MAG TPA: CdaR family protein [Verrucomicrobiae bacterium]
MRDWFIKDFGWKLFSVFLALAIWLTVHKILEESAPAPVVVSPLPPQPVAITFTNLPVLIVSAAADVREFHVTPNAVTVSVSGRPEVMSGLLAGQVHALVDLTDIEAARDLHRPVDVSMPAGVILLNVEPPEVNVVIPQQRKK